MLSTNMRNSNTLVECGSFPHTVSMQPLPEHQMCCQLINHIPISNIGANASAEPVAEISSCAACAANDIEEEKINEEFMCSSSHSNGEDGMEDDEECSSCRKPYYGPPCRCPAPDCPGGVAEFWGDHEISIPQMKVPLFGECHQVISQPTLMHDLIQPSTEKWTRNPECHIPRVSSLEENVNHVSKTVLSNCTDFGLLRQTKSLEDLPKDIQEHILKCQCSCDHLGYGNFSNSLKQLPDISKEHVSLDCSNKHKKKPSSKDLEIPSHVWGAFCLVLVLAGVGVGVSVPLALRGDPEASLPHRLQAVTEILKDTPLIDGHNDLPWNLRKFMHNKLHSFNFTADLSNLRPWSRSSWSQTDLPRLRRGLVGAQFWVSYVPCESQYLNAVQLTIEQVDLIKRLIDKYPFDLQLATSAEELERTFQEGKIASLIGVEGGHSIQNSLGVLRALYELGVRYMTLTHTCHTTWAEAAAAKESDLPNSDAPKGLTPFGKTVVREMNRIGLMVDLSHVSQNTMREALSVSRAPVLFSHSYVYSLCRNPRNVPDDVLQNLVANGGIVMVSFYNQYLTCSEQATLRDVVDHINYIRSIAGIDHVGIGADFDGVNKVPVGLEDVSKYPQLFAELLKDPSWSEEDLRKLAGLNLLRVMRKVEEISHRYRRQKFPPYEDEAPPTLYENRTNCTYKFVNDGIDM